jgi:uncharacterized membrane protein YdbT with pleckstrin-like domain
VAGTDGLAPGEQLVLRVRPHGKTLVRPAALMLLVVAAAIVAIIVIPPSISHSGQISAGIGLLALLAALVLFGVPFLKWRTTTYELTNRRLRQRTGIVARSGRDFPLNRISDVSFRQGLVDRMFGCGQLVVESPGEQGELVLSEIPDVQRVQGILFQMVGEESARMGRLDQSGF